MTGLPRGAHRPRRDRAQRRGTARARRPVQMMAVVKAERLRPRRGRGGAGGASRPGPTGSASPTSTRRSRCARPASTRRCSPGCTARRPTSRRRRRGHRSRASALDQLERRRGRRCATVHLKLDTGLSRNGFAPAEARRPPSPRAARARACGSRASSPTSSNTSRADDDAQLARLRAAARRGAATPGSTPSCVHIAATAAAIAPARAALRPGARSASASTGSRRATIDAAALGLRPAMTLARHGRRRAPRAGRRRGLLRLHAPHSSARRPWPSCRSATPTACRAPPPAARGCRSAATRHPGRRAHRDGPVRRRRRRRPGAVGDERRAVRRPATGVPSRRGLGRAGRHHQLRDRRPASGRACRAAYVPMIDARSIADARGDGGARRTARRRCCARATSSAQRRARRGQDDPHPRARRGARRARRGHQPDLRARAQASHRVRAARSCTSTRTGSAPPPSSTTSTSTGAHSIVVVEWGAGKLDGSPSDWLEIDDRAPGRRRRRSADGFARATCTITGLGERWARASTRSRRRLDPCCSPSTPPPAPASPSSTATAACSAERRRADTRGHAEVDRHAARRSLAEPGVAPAELTGVVAGMGPGPFTGLRVGIAAAAPSRSARGIPVHPGRSPRRDRATARPRARAARRHRRPPPRGRLDAPTTARRRRPPGPRRRPGPREPRARRPSTRAPGRRDQVAPASLGLRRRARSRRRPRRSARRAALPALARRHARPGAEAGDRMTWQLRRATPTDLDAIMALEDAISRRRLVARRPCAPSSPSAARLLPRRRRRTPDAIVGYAGLLAPPGRRRPTSRPSPSRPAPAGRGSARALMLRCSTRRGARGARGVPRGARRQPGRPGALPRARLRVGRCARYYQPDDVDARRSMRARRSPLRGAPRRAARMSRQPLVLGIETSCDETGIGIVRGTDAARQRRSPRHGRARPLRRRRARGRRARPPRGADARRSRRRSPRPASTLDELDAIAVTSGPGLAGALMVGVGAAKALAVSLGKPLYAVNHLVGHVGADILDADGEPLELPDDRAAGLAAGTPRCCSCATSSPTSSCSARPSTTPRARPSTRSPGCSGCPTPAGREIDRAAVGGDPKRDPVPARAQPAEGPGEAPLRLLVLRAEDRRGALGRGAREDAASEVPVADVAASFREAVVDVLVTKALAACADLGVPRLLLGGGVVANARLREVADRALPRRGHRRCASRRCRCAPTTAR